MRMVKLLYWMVNMVKQKIEYKAICEKCWRDLWIEYLIKQNGNQYVHKFEL